jgi:PKD repeat protein
MKLSYKLFILLASIAIGANTGNAQCNAYFTVVNNQTNGYVIFLDSSIFNSQYMNYSWSLGDGTTSMSPNFTHTYVAGTYNVCLTITDSLNPSCTSTFCDSVIVVDSTATCYASFSFQDTTGVLIFAPNVGGNATNYLWDFGDGTTSTSLNPPSHIFPGYGSYVVCFTASNPSTACNVTYCDSVFVSSCQTTVSFTADSTGGGVQFSSNSTGNPDTYLWNFGDGDTSSAANPYHIFTDNGYHNVCLTTSSSTDSTCLQTVCTYVIISGVCSANFSIVQDTINLNHFWIYNYSSNNTSYSWNFGDGSSSTLQYPTHTYSSTGPYNLCLTVSGNNGCTDSMCDSVYAGRASQMTITVIDPATVGIKETVTNEVRLSNYPNPFSHNTTINYSVSAAETVELGIYDLLGNKICVLEKSNKPAGNYNLVWNTEGVAEGLYILQLNTSSHKASKKIVITR